MKLSDLKSDINEVKQLLTRENIAKVFLMMMAIWIICFLISPMNTFAYTIIISFHIGTIVSFGIVMFSVYKLIINGFDDCYAFSCFMGFVVFFICGLILMMGYGA